MQVAAGALKGQDPNMPMKREHSKQAPFACGYAEVEPVKSTAQYTYAGAKAEYAPRANSQASRSNRHASSIVFGDENAYTGAPSQAQQGLPPRPGKKIMVSKGAGGMDFGGYGGGVAGTNHWQRKV